jgi:cation diffusion facilitator CzcD-associated flavoprotein CzcO
VVWDEQEQKWNIGTNTGQKFKARYFLPNTGFAAKRHIPNWSGIDQFKGTFLHPSFWPKIEPSVKGKRVAVIGTGSTGVSTSFHNYSRYHPTALTNGQ